MTEKQLLDHKDYQNLILSNFDEKLISKIHKQVKRQHSISGTWSDQQNQIYANFIEAHPFEFQTAEKRRKFKVFERMAMKLPNRTAIQCRSHNQKMVKLAGSIMRVPGYIKRRLLKGGKREEEAIEVGDEEKEELKNVSSEKPQMEKNWGEGDTVEARTSEGSVELAMKLVIEIKGESMEEW